MPLIEKNTFAEAISLHRVGLRSLALPLMKLLRIERINKIYDRFKHNSGIEFLDACLNELQITYNIPPNDLKNVPASGAVVFVANHPYGGLDGIILIRLIASIRPDFKVMANFVLSNIEPLKDYFLPVDPFERINSTQKSLAGTKKTLEILKNGGAVGVFPAGEVSAFYTNRKKISDKPWNPMIGRLILKSGAKVIPIYFSGSNSLLFNLLGLIHPRLRTAWLPSELLNKKEFHVGIRIGKPISNEELQEFKDVNQLMRFLRAKTYALGSSFEVKKNYFASPLRAKIKPEAVIEPVDQQTLEEEINRIKLDSLVTTFNQYELYFCYSTAIPNTIREIGRLRELTFREVGEGTNRAIDIDEFDLCYHHLFIWDTAVKRIIGAYRIGKGADLFQKFGVKGFYVNTLFHINPRFYPILKQSIELGRSFIVKDYQQKVFVLYLLWRGILTFLRNNPEYRYLIGPVSISNNFLKVSKSILVHFIKKHYWDAEMASMVKERKPFKVKLSSIDAEILLGRNHDSSFKCIDDIISELEPQSFKAPILLKKYLKQNARIIAFNIDPKFNNALDGFIVMDFRSIPEDTLQMLEKQNS